MHVEKKNCCSVTFVSFNSVESFDFVPKWKWFGSMHFFKETVLFHWQLMLITQTQNHILNES